MQPADKKSMLYQAEENYIKIIYKIIAEVGGEASTNAIANEAQTKAASVSDMLRKLVQKGLINYVKYQGVTLTEEGRRHALSIIRKHRLWEVFLVNKLGFKWEEIHEIAEQLEHIQSPDLIERLDAFLEYPQFDPHGDPIPNARGEFAQKQQVFLSDMDPGKRGTVAGVKDSSTVFLQYLDKIGIAIGSGFEIVDKIEYDQSVELRVDGRKMFISHDVAQNLYSIE
jgi:DtxR family Mn-dependent transcriptional regulator